VEAGDGAFNTYYGIGAGEHVRRGLMVDLDLAAVEEARTSTCSQLFPEQLWLGKKDAADSTVQGHYTIRGEIVELGLDWVRKLADDYTGLQGFMVYKVLGRGTLSGSGCGMLQRVMQNNLKQCRASRISAT
jgi:tubulin alpha